MNGPRQVQRAALALAALVATSGIAVRAEAQRQSPAQRRCIAALDASARRVARAVAHDLVRCVRLAGSGKLPAGQSAQTCLGADGSGAVARARARTARVAARACTVPPDFGPRSTAAVNAMFDPLHQVAAAFGAPLDGAILLARSDPSGARCQLEIARGMAAIGEAKLRAYAECADAGLSRGRIRSAEELEACRASDVHGFVAGAIDGAQRAIDRACEGVAPAHAAPGQCSGATSDALATCLEPRVDCDVCLGLDAANGTAVPCHRFAQGVAVAYCGDRPATGQSVARQWDEETLAAIRLDTPRPGVHARNLFHVSVAMWDAWASYDPLARAYLTAEHPASIDPHADREVAISFAAYRVLRQRFAHSPNAATSLARFDARLYALGYDKSFGSTTGASPAAVGNRIGAAVVAHGLADGANEANDYADPTYVPLNEPLIVKQPGTTLAAPNHWQPLALDVMIGQNGVPIPGKIQTFIGSAWGQVLPFAISRPDPSDVYVDPGLPPLLGGAGDDVFKDSALEVIRFSSRLDAGDPTLVDLSPAVHGNNPLGTNDGTGWGVNPVTGATYAPNVVKRGDYGRVLAEFWADGPTSETPPGHWNVIANGVSDTPSFEKRFMGTGDPLDPLEWDVKLYFALNGAVHDAAIAAWDAKRKYDYVRPISMIRFMGGKGQSSDPGGPAYDPSGLPLVPGLVEVITDASSAPGERHEALAAHVGEIAIVAWPGEPADPVHQTSGVRWLRAVEWVPYQRKTFVTPAFAAYVSGHSTFSRSAAEVLSRFTGSPYFPGGLGEYRAPQDAFLRFERGPSQDVVLQWASYADAADEAGISRLWGGIHVRSDDFAGRRMGAQIGPAAFAKAQRYFDGSAP